MLELHTELTLVSALHPSSWTSHTFLPEPPRIRRVSAAHPERINSMRLQTSPPTELLPAQLGMCTENALSLLQLCVQPAGMDQTRSYQRHMEDQSLGHRSRAGSHLKHQLCSCHTVQGSEPPSGTQTHTWMPGKCLPPGTAKEPMAHPKLLPLH